MRLGLVINPTAGHGRAGPLAATVRTGLAAAGHDVVDLSRATYTEAVTAARQALAAGLDAIVVAGGDGMVHLGANVLAGTSMPLGIVAIGTGNDIAGALGLPVHDVGASVRTITAALERGEHQAVDAVALSRPGQVPDRWYISSLCTAIEAAVAQRATSLAWPRGGGRYVRAAISEVARFRPYGIRITADGVTWQGPVTLAVVASTAVFGGGMRIAPDARPDDGLLDVVTAGPLRRHQLLRLLPTLYDGGHISHPAVQVHRVRSVRIDAAPEEGRPPPPALADGELVGSLPMQCDVHPGALRVLNSPVGTGTSTLGE